MGGGDDSRMQGEDRKRIYLVGQRTDMIILRGSAQPKKSKSLCQIFSHLQRTFILKNKCFTDMLVI